MESKNATVWGYIKGTFNIIRNFRIAFMNS